MILTYRYRVKSNLGRLNSQARAANFVWNYCNETQRHAVRWGRRWLSANDLCYLTAGSSADLGLSATTINMICKQYAVSRTQKRRPWLRYRGMRSLGWVPLRARDVRPVGGGFKYCGALHRVFMSRPIPKGAKIKDGSSFTQDARGNWFLNVVVDLPDPEAREPRRAVGVDLGLTTLATLSTGEKIENPRHVRVMAERLAKAQRAGKKRLTRNLHARTKSARRDYLHKQSSRLCREFDLIVVGDVAPAPMAKTRLAKSVLDAGWTTFRDQLRYKAIAHGATFEEVSEYGTTRVCSACGCTSGPKGVADLGIRQWKCGECGAVHDRDVNSAVLILARSGHRPPAEGARA